MKERFKLLELRISHEETQLKRSQGKAKNRHGRFHYFDCLLTKISVSNGCHFCGRESGKAENLEVEVQLHQPML